jgi:hypothetical protein
MVREMIASALLTHASTRAAVYMLFLMSATHSQCKFKKCSRRALIAARYFDECGTARERFQALANISQLIWRQVK